MMRARSVFLLTSAIGTLGVGLAVGPTQSRKKPVKTVKAIDFNRDIRPILSEHCFKCHGPDGKEVKGNLRVSDQKDATRDRGGYWAIKPGDPQHSVLVDRTTPGNDSPMPPKDSGMVPLTAEQSALLKEWVKQGAKYEKHWAFVPPKMPAIPVVKNKAWIKNPIDNFVLEKLEAKGLKPEPEADAATLLRRASLTLTGLLPTPAEIDAIKNDKQPGAYERAVDRLLTSERYGEHQARYWLDAVRYGDTHGLHLDNERAVYPYRDWVVRAFNQDLGFDKFTEWQLAGDLMPNPTTDMKVATGYVRMNPTSSEGGAIEEEFLVRNTQDRVDTMSTVFLGLSVGCAKCHDHKFDPITTKDYYQLFAYFNSTKDAPLDGNMLSPEPTIPAPTAEEAAELQKGKDTLLKIESETSPDTAQKWVMEHRVAPPKLTPWEVSTTFRHKTFDEAFATDETPDKWSALKLEAGKGIALASLDNSSNYLRTTISAEADRDLIFRVSSDDGIKMWLNGALVHSNKVLRSIDESVDVVTLKLKKGENPLVVKIVNATGGDGIRYTYGTDLETKVEEAFKKNDPLFTKQTFLKFGPDDAKSKQYRETMAAVTKLDMAIPRTLIAEEMPKPRQAYILRRGEYNLRADKVDRALPAALGTLPAGAPNNRLGLAQWLIDKNNPLTMRVFVNRIWQQHFGTGIVKTAEDFGAQGEWPSHPELLDYLSVKFAQDGYSIKKLHRLLVTSAAFRQRSSISQNKEKIDPENRLVSRGPRFRLDAEVLRDQALQVSGLLINREGGHGFKPYQPAGLWEDVAYPDSNTAKYKQDMTADIYRRTLYLFWKRTSPHPVMSSFDAPSREACVVRRSRTNTPLQALITMNEPAFMESARIFGERLVREKKGMKPRLNYAFRLSLGRSPTATEEQILLASATKYEARFKAEPAQAEALSSVGMAPAAKGLPKDEVATWTVIANTIFNLDEFLNQH